VSVTLDPSRSAGNEPDTVIIEVAGELNSDTASRLQEECIRLIAAGRRVITLDLHGLNFIDSAGLNVIVGAAKPATQANGRLAVRFPPPSIGRALDLANLARTVTIVE
jgi:stage II sporulation protein AA (anti-sigma F factor antagonist)